MSAMTIGLLAVFLALLFYGCGLVGASMPPVQTRAKAGTAPYKFLRIQLRGRAKDTGLGNGLTVYRQLILTFDYGPGPGNACNPQANQQSQKISLVQGPATVGTAPTFAAAGAGVTVAGGVITAIAMTGNGSGYNLLVPPQVTIIDTGANPGQGAYATATVSATGTISSINVIYGGSGYTAATTVVIVNTNNYAGFQGTVAWALIANALAKDWINDGIYARWIDTPSDLDLQCGLGTGALAAFGVVPAGGYLTPTGDGGVGALGSRLPLDNNVTWHKYTGDKGRSWTGKSWHPSCVPTTFFTNDDMSLTGRAVWGAIKASAYQPITDGTSVLYPILVSQRNSELEVPPTLVTWASLIQPGLDPVRGVYNPLVNYTLGEARRRKEKHGLTF